MKKCLASRYIKKTDLRSEENKRILQDFFAFNSMKRTSFLWQRQDRKFFRDDGKERSHQLKLKDVFECIHEPTGKPVGLIFKINLIGTTCKTDRISLALSE